MKKSTRRTIAQAAKFIRREAKMGYESNRDGDGWVNDRAAWKWIKATRKLARKVRAIARRAK